MHEEKMLQVQAEKERQAQEEKMQKDAAATAQEKSSREESPALGSGFDHLPPLQRQILMASTSSWRNAADDYSTTSGGGSAAYSVSSHQNSTQSYGYPVHQRQQQRHQHQRQHQQHQQHQQQQQFQRQQYQKQQLQEQQLQQHYHETPLHSRYHGQKSMVPPRFMNRPPQIKPQMYQRMVHEPGSGSMAGTVSASYSNAVVASGASPPDPRPTLADDLTTQASASRLALADEISTVIPTPRKALADDLTAQSSPRKLLGNDSNHQNSVDVPLMSQSRNVWHRPVINNSQPENAGATVALDTSHTSSALADDLTACTDDASTLQAPPSDSSNALPSNLLPVDQTSHRPEESVETPADFMIPILEEGTSEGSSYFSESSEVAMHTIPLGSVLSPSDLITSGSGEGDTTLQWIRMVDQGLSGSSRSLHKNSSRDLVVNQALATRDSTHRATSFSHSPFTPSMHVSGDKSLSKGHSICTLNMTAQDNTQVAASFSQAPSTTSMNASIASQNQGHSTSTTNIVARDYLEYPSDVEQDGTPSSAVESEDTSIQIQDKIRSSDGSKHQESHTKSQSLSDILEYPSEVEADQSQGQPSDSGTPSRDFKSEVVEQLITAASKGKEGTEIKTPPTTNGVRSLSDGEAHHPDGVPVPLRLPNPQAKKDLESPNSKLLDETSESDFSVGINPHSAATLRRMLVEDYRLVPLESNQDDDERIRVCVLGCGPAAMMFMHAIRAQKRTNIHVTVYEVGNGPTLRGGVVSHEDVKPVKHSVEENSNYAAEEEGAFVGLEGEEKKDESSTTDNDQSSEAKGRYDEISTWCQVPKELNEFWDYSFSQYFSEVLAEMDVDSKERVFSPKTSIEDIMAPAYLPEDMMLDYLTRRCGCAGMLEEIIDEPSQPLNDSIELKFEHEVLSVSQNDVTGKFHVVTRDISNGTSTRRAYDRVVCATGTRTTPHTPPDVNRILCSEGYTGNILHCSEIKFTMGTMEGAGRTVLNPVGLTVMLIGDSYTAEDVALQCVRRGAKAVYIASRDGGGVVSGVRWNTNVVRIITALPYKVVHGTGLKCQAVYYDEDVKAYVRNKMEPSIRIKNVAAVIYCTGFETDMDYLEPSLRIDPDARWSASEDWTMRENLLTKALGDVPPAHDDKFNPLFNCGLVHPSLYRCSLIQNPDMYFIQSNLMASWLDMDVQAWFVVKSICEDCFSLNLEERFSDTQDWLEESMQTVWLRYGMDPAYQTEFYACLPPRHWAIMGGNDVRYFELCLEQTEFEIRLIARNALLANYPVDFGDGKFRSHDTLSPIGKHVAVQSHQSYVDRIEDVMSFRNRRFASKFTGVVSMPLSWLEVRTKADLLQKVQQFNRRTGFISP